MIDTNAYLGHFAFRQLRHNTARGLLALMDKHRIERAWVSSAAAITYRNAQSGNEEVAAEIRGHADRFTQFAVINPAYAGWRDDLAICREQFGARGLRLYPRWHRYALTSAECVELVNRAAGLGMVVSIPLRVEDRRQQSWLVDVPDVEKDEIAAIARACPRAHFVLGNGTGFAGSALTRAGAPGNFSVDISLLTAAIQNELGQLVSRLGEDRILFGTGMPFHYPDPAILKVQIADLSQAAKSKIFSGNARRLIGS
ncbi:MAG: amidohydrolase family protein [Bryobacteraceae bacterium]